MNLVPVSKCATSSPANIFKSRTYYKWFHVGKYPEIFRKVGGALFIDVDSLENLIENQPRRVAR